MNNPASPQRSRVKVNYLGASGREAIHASTTINTHEGVNIHVGTEPPVVSIHSCWVSSCTFNCSKFIVLKFKGLKNITMLYNNLKIGIPQVPLNTICISGSIGLGFVAVNFQARGKKITNTFFAPRKAIDDRRFLAPALS